VVSNQDFGAVCLRGGRHTVGALIWLQKAETPLARGSREDAGGGTRTPTFGL
jgi:hypothetical protein